MVSFHTVKPLDEPLLEYVFAHYRAVVTIEEHSLLGGLGGSVAEWLADRPPQRARLVRVGTADAFMHEAGNQEYARRHYGLTPERIADRTLRVLRWRASEGITGPAAWPAALST